MRQPIQVLVYPARRTGDYWEYLLLRRVPGRGGFWQGVTGGVEKGEELESAAKREIIEETRFSSFTLERIDYSYTFPIEDKWRRIYGYEDDVKEILEHVFIAYVEEKEPRIDPEEHDRWKWFRFDEALKTLAFPNNREALRRCHNAAMSRG